MREHRPAAIEAGNTNKPDGGEHYMYGYPQDNSVCVDRGKASPHYHVHEKLQCYSVSSVVAESRRVCALNIVCVEHFQS